MNPAVQFKYCTVELQRSSNTVVTRFNDGTEAHACPHDTPEYHAHALEKTGIDDVMLYCFAHDLAHVIYAQLHDSPSVVLWALAHGESTDTEECAEEEREAQALQMAFQMGRTIT